MIAATTTYPMTPKPEDVLAAMENERRTLFSRMYRRAGLIRAI
ncbi:hypothetical protein PO124_02885 [Bacillus licheniformis]|nr:hypothetical protein [Bacillus licheniformis]